MIVIVDEMIDQICRMQKGIPVNGDTLALDVIPVGVKEGQFLTQAHTVKHLRNVQWQPHLFYRKGYEQWVEEGRTRLLDRARKKLNRILDRHEPVGIVQDKKQAIDAVVERFRNGDFV
jgi:trimethylamine--corrinoid protein Co-methyltransferase